MFKPFFMTTQSSTRAVKLIAIGNSRGIRLPQILLRRYGMDGQITVEERPDGLLLRGAESAKASLRQTFVEMAREQTAGSDDWSDMEGTTADGLDKLKW